MRQCLGLLLLVCLSLCTDYRKCYQNFKRKELRCKGHNLGAVPANLPSYLVKLEIRNDDLSNGFEFPELSRLKKLWLTNVNIGKEIPKLAFAKLRALEDLRIQYIPVTPKNFSITIHPEAFHMLPHLSTVRLINLGVAELPEMMFKDSPNLKHIYISGSKIESIKSNTFAPLERVEQLNLMHNKISTIEEGTFDCLNSNYRAPRIYLSNNRLRTIPSYNHDDRIQMSIQDNPIVCDCNLVIPRAFYDRRAKCVEPSALKNTFILSLKGKEIQCDSVCQLPTITNGAADHDTALQPGEKLSIRCDPGYSLTVIPDIECLEDGTFGGSEIPQCVEDRIEPEELEDGSLRLKSNAYSVYPNYLTLTCPDDTVLKSCMCTEFTCRGVVLSDTSCKVYAAPGNATKGEMICVPNDLVLAHYTHYVTEDVVHLAACRNFYQMTACTNYNPTNRAVSNYGVLEPDMSGVCRVDCGNTDCDMYIRCLIIVEKQECDKFSIYEGTVTKNGVEMTASTTFKEGDVVTITCNEGYEFDVYEPLELTEDGGAILECIEGEVYDPPEIPMCYEIIPTCELTPIENVVADPGWIVYELDTITLSCEEGYEGQEEVIDCKYGGVFEEPQIVCQPKVLAECYVRPIPHTVLSLSDGSLLQEFSVQEGTVINVACEDGYQPSTSYSSVTCLDTGKLSEEIPLCTEIPEPEIEGCVVPLIRNAELEGHSPGDKIEPGTVISFQCNEGFQLVEPSITSLTCVSNQYYSPNRLPRCKKRIVRCVVPFIANGYYPSYQVGQEISRGQSLYAVCEPNHEKTGPDYITCIDGGFGDEVNTCEREKIDCDIPTIAHGRVLNDGKAFKENDKYPIVCDRGYYNTYTYINCVVGPSTYDPYSVPDCLLPESYQGCPKVGFPLMKPLLEEPNKGETVEVECIEGYTLEGESTLTCGSRNDFTARKLPECVPIAGCETPIIENGRTNTTLSHLEDGIQLRITCDSDFVVYGDSVITCQKGSWSGIITPECRPSEEKEADCIMPYTNNGHFWPLSDDGIYNPGATLVLHCDDGYGVENNFDRVMCVTKAKFDPPLLPECVELEITGCPAPNIDRGQVVPNYGIGVGDTVQVTCQEGYELLGPEEIVCGADGGYEEIPVCNEMPTRCPVPEIESAIVTPGDPIIEGESYLVVCIQGYERVGDEELVCGEDGETFGILNGDRPVCRKIPEPCTRPSIRNGWIAFDEDEDEIAYGSEAFVICNQPNYGPDQTRVTCVGNNQWEPPLPRCTWEGPTCEFPKVPNGVVSPRMDVVMPWVTLTITCNEGFEKNPKVDIECIHSGNIAYFNNKVPVCEQVKLQCNRPEIQDGYINGPDPLETDDRFTVECNEGFERVGPGGPLVCYKDDIYSRHLPVCQQKDMNITKCYEPYVQNANIVGTPLTGYYVTVVCKEGYSIEGPSQLQCLSNGQFDQPMPQCVRKQYTPSDSEERVAAVVSKGCGERSSTFIERIYGGNSAEPGEYPWNVLIEFTRGRVCGGSIISREWVLTAGHCLLNNMYRTCDNREDPGCRLMSPRDVISISAGVNDKDERDGNWQVRTATEVVTHPYFTSQTTYIDYDVGLIKVNKPFSYNDRVNRVCLPKDGMGHLVGNRDLHVTGWGKTNTTRFSDVLQKILVPYVSRETCNAEISYDGAITETMFCAGYQKGLIDACQGDSGGPLVYLGSNGTFVQGGIISWGRQCAMENFYGVYTNLAYFYSWIMGYIGEN